jgi:hypothetical protein
MTFKHNTSFLQSEVMRSLERDAVKKGHFDPKPEEIVAAAAFKVKRNNFAPSDNLHNDIVKLTRGLRERGLDSFADDIEKNEFILKTAETHLYRVHDEDGADIINFAHPDGPAQIFPGAQKELGHFETVISAHVKFLEVVKKQPTGQNVKLAPVVEEVMLAEDAPIESVAGLIRFAQADSGVKTEVTQKLQLVKDNVSNIVETIGSDHIKSPVGVAATECSKFANSLASNPNPSHDDIRRLRVSIINLRAMVSRYGDYASLTSLYFKEAISNIEDAYKLTVPTPAQTIDTSKLPAGISEDPIGGMAQVIAGKLERLANSALRDTDPNTKKLNMDVKFDAMGRAIRAVQNNPNITFKEVLAQLVATGKLTSEEQNQFVSVRFLDNWVMRWENYYRSMGILDEGKQASTNHGLKVTAQNAPEPKTKGKAAPAATGTKGGPAGVQTSKTQLVKKMQEDLNAFYDALAKKYSVPPLSKSPGAAEIASWKTYVPYPLNPDNNWGPATSRALTALKLDSDPGANIDEAAQKNIEQIKLFGIRYLGKAREYDVINNQTLTSKHFNSLVDLVKFIENVGGEIKETEDQSAALPTTATSKQTYISKLANIIKSSQSTVKLPPAGYGFPAVKPQVLGPQVTLDTTPPAIGPTEEPSTITAQQLNQALEILQTRAGESENQQYIADVAKLRQQLKSVWNKLPPADKQSMWNGPMDLAKLRTHTRDQYGISPDGKEVGSAAQRGGGGRGRGLNEGAGAYTGADENDPGAIALQNPPFTDEHGRVLTMLNVDSLANAYIKEGEKSSLWIDQPLIDLQLINTISYGGSNSAVAIDRMFDIYATEDAKSELLSGATTKARWATNIFYQIINQLSRIFKGWSGAVDQTSPKANAVISNNQQAFMRWVSTLEKAKSVADSYVRTGKA